MADITISIKGEFRPNELAALLQMLRKMNTVNDDRPWTILVDDPGSTLAEAEDLLRRFFANVSSHPTGQ